MVSFYKDGGTDALGRTLETILQFDDDTLAQDPDHIYWLFPLEQQSRKNPNAPTLTEADIAEFKADPEIQNNMRRAFNHMLSFYGLQDNGEKIIPAHNCFERVNVWVDNFSPHFNNISRILKSLNAVGLKDEAKRFMLQLDALYNFRPNISAVVDISDSYGHWRKNSGLTASEIIQSYYAAPEPKIEP